MANATLKDQVQARAIATAANEMFAFAYGYVASAGALPSNTVLELEWSRIGRFRLGDGGYGVVILDTWTRDNWGRDFLQCMTNGWNLQEMTARFAGGFINLIKHEIHNCSERCPTCGQLIDLGK